MLSSLSCLISRTAFFFSQGSAAKVLFLTKLELVKSKSLYFLYLKPLELLAIRRIYLKIQKQIDEKSEKLIG